MFEHFKRRAQFQPQTVNHVLSVQQKQRFAVDFLADEDVGPVDPNHAHEVLAHVRRGPLCHIRNARVQRKFLPIVRQLAGVRMQMRRNQRQQFIRVVAAAVDVVAFVAGPTAVGFDLDRGPVTRHVVAQITRVAKQHLFIFFRVCLFADAAGLAVGTLPRGRQDLLGELL